MLVAVSASQYQHRDQHRVATLVDALVRSAASDAGHYCAHVYRYPVIDYYPIIIPIIVTP